MANLVLVVLSYFCVCEREKGKLYMYINGGGGGGCSSLLANSVPYS